MKPKYIKYLKEFDAKKYFKNQTSKKYFDFFQDFFKEENLLKLENLSKEESWKIIREIRLNVHSLKTPAFAGWRAFPDVPNHEISRYINFLKYLVLDNNESQEVKIRKIINRTDSLYIRGLGTSSLSEIASQAFPNDYVFYNKRNKIAGEFLGLDFKISKNDDDGYEFIRYNNALKPVIEKYKEIIYNNKIDKLHSETTIPHELDQFFNWLYENKIFNSDDNKIFNSDDNNKFINGKVSKIILSSYNQFKKDLEIDLTYPKGHDKAGKPLDKICIIGQSGTGKTSLLKLIKGFTLLNNDDLPKAIINSVKIEYIENNYKYIVEPGKNKISFKKNKIFKKEEEFPTGNPFPRLINFPANTTQEKKLTNKTIKDIKDSPLIDFDVISPYIFWQNIKEDLNRYQNEKIKTQANIFKDLKNNLKKDYQKIIKEWDKNNKNPLIELRDFFDPIFSKFSLKVKTEIENFGEINNIPIETKFGEEIENQYLSLGTQQVISRALPLYSLQIENPIILYDEPENSLYPDIQKQIIDFFIEKFKNTDEKNYKNVNPQFFFATHSPTIASAFDPWEIIELKFDTEGKVIQENYMKNNSIGRHIDNYKFYPKYLRWDKIFTKIFDLEKDGHEKRFEKMMELAEIKEEIKYLKKNNNEPIKINKLIEKFKEVANKLNWDYNNAML